MKTSFKGTINGKEFDNVQDYNAEMQRLIAEGQPINAHADTRTVEELDNSFLFPGFAQCENVDKLNDDFIDAALELDPDKFIDQVNGLLHDRIIPAINEMPETTISKYSDLVDGILNYLEGLATESDARAEQTTKRLQAIEKELAEIKTKAEVESDRKAVIDFVTNVYNGIADAIDARSGENNTPKPCEGDCNPNSPGADYIDVIKRKARELFGL